MAPEWAEYALATIPLLNRKFEGKEIEVRDDCELAIMQAACLVMSRLHFFKERMNWSLL